MLFQIQPDDRDCLSLSKQYRVLDYLVDVIGDRQGISELREALGATPELHDWLPSAEGAAARVRSIKFGGLNYIRLPKAPNAWQARSETQTTAVTADPECYTSGLREACYSGNIDVIKKLKPDANRDDLSELLHSAAISGKREALRYLLEIGANPNLKPSGGSTALDTAIWRLSFGPLHRDGLLRSRYAVSDSLECIGELLAHGAVWNPEPYNLRSLRKTLLECEPEVTIELLQLFRKHNACPAELVHKLLGTPRMKEHLVSQAWHLSRLGLTLLEKGNPKATSRFRQCNPFR